MTINEALARVSAICATPAVAGQRNAAALMDAHTYTRTLIKNDYPVLRAIDDEFTQSAADEIAFPDMVNLFKAFTAETLEFSAAQTANLNRILDLTTGFVNSKTRGVENSETGISIPELLLRSWTLANRIAQRNRDISYPTEIIDCLEANISDAGKCMPGVVARLYAIYARFLNYELEALAMRQRTGYFPSRGAASASSVRVTTEEEQLQLAMAASLSLTQAPRTTATTERHDDGLDLALALSLQEREVVATSIAAQTTVSTQRGATSATTAATTNGYTARAQEQRLQRAREEAEQVNGNDQLITLTASYQKAGLSKEKAETKARLKLGLT